IVEKDFQPDKTIDLGNGRMMSSGKHIFHQKLGQLYKEFGEDKSEYDMLLLFICRWLGLEDVFL
ncbi:MAG: hypothetical protein GY950_28030, partial [bacterium]|nr:hypothetical protein [bacterium]